MGFSKRDKCRLATFHDDVQWQQYFFRCWSPCANWWEPIIPELAHWLLLCPLIICRWKPYSPLKACFRWFLSLFFLFLFILLMLFMKCVTCLPFMFVGSLNFPSRQSKCHGLLCFKVIITIWAFAPSIDDEPSCDARCVQDAPAINHLEVFIVFPLFAR